MQFYSNRKIFAAARCLGFLLQAPPQFPNPGCATPYNSEIKIGQVLQVVHDFQFYKCLTASIIETFSIINLIICYLCRHQSIMLNKL